MGTYFTETSHMDSTTKDRRLNEEGETMSFTGYIKLKTLGVSVDTKSVPHEIRGERDLIAAIIERTVRDLIVPPLMATRSDIRDSEQWFRSNAKEPFSFLWCCDHLSLDPEYLREQVASMDMLDINSRWHYR